MKKVRERPCESLSLSNDTQQIENFRSAKIERSDFLQAQIENFRSAKIERNGFLQAQIENFRSAKIERSGFLHPADDVQKIALRIEVFRSADYKKEKK